MSEYLSPSIELRDDLSFDEWKVLRDDLAKQAENMDLLSIASTDEIEQLRGQLTRVCLDEDFLKRCAVEFQDLEEDDPYRQKGFSAFVDDILIFKMGGGKPS